MDLHPPGSRGIKPHTFGPPQPWRPETVRKGRSLQVGSALRTRSTGISSPASSGAAAHEPRRAAGNICGRKTYEKKLYNSYRSATEKLSHESPIACADSTCAAAHEPRCAAGNILGRKTYEKKYIIHMEAQLKNFPTNPQLLAPILYAHQRMNHAVSRRPLYKNVRKAANISNRSSSQTQPPTNPKSPAPSFLGGQSPVCASSCLA